MSSYRARVGRFRREIRSLGGHVQTRAAVHLRGLRARHVRRLVSSDPDTSQSATSVTARGGSILGGEGGVGFGLSGVHKIKANLDE